MHKRRRRGFTLDRALGGDRDHRRPDRPTCCPRCKPLAKRLAGLNASNNLKQIGLALHNYHTAIDKFPMGVSKNPVWGGPATPTRRGATAAGPAGAPRRSCWATSTRPRCTMRRTSLGAPMSVGLGTGVRPISTVY